MSSTACIACGEKYLLRGICKSCGHDQSVPITAGPGLAFWR